MGFWYVIPYILKSNYSKLWMTISSLNFFQSIFNFPTVADIYPTVAVIILVYMIWNKVFWYTMLLHDMSTYIITEYNPAIKNILNIM